MMKLDKNEKEEKKDKKKLKGKTKTCDKADFKLMIQIPLKHL